MHWRRNEEVVLDLARATWHLPRYVTFPQTWDTGNEPALGEGQGIWHCMDWMLLYGPQASLLIDNNAPYYQYPVDITDGIG